MQPQDDPERVLSQTYPPFLVQLASGDSNGAFAEFDRCARAWLKHNPVACMRSLTDTEREQLIEGLISHLTDNDSARLRAYKDQGIPFTAFLRRATTRRCISIIKGRKRGFSLDEPQSGGNSGNVVVAPTPNPDHPILAEIIWKYASQLGAECLLGLMARYVDGYDPKDIVFVLGRGLAKGENAKVSDGLSYCEEKLLKLILDDGFTKDDFLD